MDFAKLLITQREFFEVGRSDSGTIYRNERSVFFNRQTVLLKNRRHRGRELMREVGGFFVFLCFALGIGAWRVTEKPSKRPDPC